MVDALALRADERRDKLRKASGRGKYPLIRRFLNGETYLSKPQVSWRQSITSGREPGELKHLSSRRKRKQHVILWVAASENGRAQTSVRACWGSDRGIDSTSLAVKSVCSVRMTLAIHPLLLFWKSLASITRINNVRSENFILEFSGMVAVQLSMFLFAVSLRQLVYYISLAVACQQLFYFSFSRISVVFRQPK